MAFGLQNDSTPNCPSHHAEYSVPVLACTMCRRSVAGHSLLRCTTTTLPEMMFNGSSLCSTRTRVSEELVAPKRRANTDYY